MTVFFSGKLEVESGKFRVLRTAIIKIIGKINLLFWIFYKLGETFVSKMYLFAKPLKCLEAKLPVNLPLATIFKHIIYCIGELYDKNVF